EGVGTELVVRNRGAALRLEPLLIERRHLEVSQLPLEVPAHEVADRRDAARELRSEVLAVAGREQGRLGVVERVEVRHAVDRTLAPRRALEGTLARRPAGQGVSPRVVVRPGRTRCLANAHLG